MRFSNRTTCIIFGIILGLGITAIPPDVTFGASYSFARSGRSRAVGVHRERSVSPRLPHFGFFDVGGDGGQQVIIIQQFQFPATTEPREPTRNQIYVPPRWVDGGYGVQILNPGYWTDQKPAAEH